MKWLCCLSLVFVFFVAAWSQDDIDLHGKTKDQVLKMGREAWNKFYTSKEGDSTAAMAGAEVAFGDCVKWKNDQRIAKLSASKRAAIKRVREQLIPINNQSETCGEALTGGGTMWNIIGAAYVTDGELMIQDLLKQKKAKSSEAKAYQRALSQLASARKTLVGRKADIKSYAIGGTTPYEDSMAALSDIKKAFNAIKADKGLSSNEKALILEYGAVRVRDAIHAGSD